MTSPTAGWYADPHGGAGLRYWNGGGWTESTQPGPNAAPDGSAGYPPGVQAGYPPGGAAGYPPGGWPASAPGPAGGSPSVTSPWVRSKFTLITGAVCVAYAVIATFSGFALFGILPVLFTVRAFQAKEPLATVAAVLTAATVIYSIYQLNL